MPNRVRWAGLAALASARIIARYGCDTSAAVRGHVPAGAARPGQGARSAGRGAAARADLVRRAGRSPRLLPRRVRRAAALARRADLRRPRGALPVPARAGQQPGRHRRRRHARRPARRAGGLARVHPALRRGADAFALSASARSTSADAGWLHGLKVVAVAVVAQAVWGMARKLCPDRPRATLAIVAALVALACARRRSRQIVVIALAGADRLARPAAARAADLPSRAARRSAGALGLVGCWALFFALLIALPLLRGRGRQRHGGWRWSTASTASARWSSAAATSCCRCCRPRSCRPGWVSNEQFLAGYGAAQAVPGPLFTFSAYLGAVAAARRTASLGAAHRAGRDLPAVVPAGGRRAAVLGRACAAARLSQAPCAASTRPSSASCSPRSTRRSGPAPSCGPPISRLAVAAFGLLMSGSCRPGWWCCSPPPAAPTLAAFA